jgi:hypothetical protein
MPDYFFSDGPGVKASSWRSPIPSFGLPSICGRHPDSGPDCLVALGPQTVRKMIEIHRLRPTWPVAVEMLFAQVNTPFQPIPIATAGSRHAVECFPWYY